MAGNPLRSRSTQIAREHRNAAKSASSYWRLYCRRASRLKQWRRKAIVKRPPPLRNGGQIPTMPIWSFTGIEKSAYAFLEGIAHGAQLEEAIRAARRIAPSFDSAATLDFLFAEGLIVGVR
jgi:hypothetical protein